MSTTFGIIGLGIMGGSIAKAIRKNVISLSKTDDKIFALDKNATSLAKAIETGIIDKGFNQSETKEMLLQCDYVFICLYPKATINFLQENRNNFKDDAIITDISGVKHDLAQKYNELCPPNATLILGHPMAGGEKEGFEASKGEYFINHNYLLITNSKADDKKIGELKNLITKMGFSKITMVDADTHDNKIGFTSQLCHVVASAMVESARDPEITSFGGGSFEDLTRIAMINAPLWTELFLSNKEKLLSHIETFKSELTNIQNLIEKEDAESLQSLLEDVRKKRIEMQK